MPLTDMEIRAAKPSARLVKFSDGGGLQLWIMPDGAKRWRLAYRFDGSQKLLAIDAIAARTVDLPTDVHSFQIVLPDSMRAADGPSMNHEC